MEGRDGRVGETGDEEGVNKEGGKVEMKAGAGGREVEVAGPELEEPLVFSLFTGLRERLAVRGSETKEPVG